MSVAEDDEMVGLAIEGMTCASCAGRVERALARVPGVASVAVNLATEQAHVQVAGAISTRDLIAAVEKSGYHARVRLRAAAGADAARERAARRERRHVAIAAMLTIPLIAPMLPPHSACDCDAARLAAVRAGHAGAVLARRALLSGRLEARCGPAPATWTCWWRSAPRPPTGLSRVRCWLTLRARGMHLYFEASAVVITLVLLGKWLEARAKRQTTATRSARCTRCAPTSAHACRATAPRNELPIGAGAGRRPGGGAAGRAHAGRRRGARRRAAHVDESLLTGESLPVAEGSRATRVTGGADQRRGRAASSRPPPSAPRPTLARIIRLVESAQAAKAPIQRLVDRVAAVFVPVVLAIAAGDAARLAGWAGARGDRDPERGRGAGDRLPLRARAGDAGRDHGRHRRRRAPRHPDQGRARRWRWRIGSRWSPSTRPAR